MPKPAILKAVLAAVAVLVLAGVLLSVLRDDGPAAPPQGYATFAAEVGGRTVSFAYPRAWGAVQRGSEQGVRTFRFRGPPDPQGERSVVRLAADPGATTSFQSQYGLVDGNDRLQLANDREIEEKDVDVPGAEQAKRRVLEYDLSTDDGGTQRSRSSTIFALSKDGLFVSLVADTSAEDPDVDADAVLASLTLDG
jgi:hypothetical protein